DHAIANYLSVLQIGPARAGPGGTSGRLVRELQPNPEARAPHAAAAGETGRWRQTERARTTAGSPCSRRNRRAANSVYPAQSEDALDTVYRQRRRDRHHYRRRLAGHLLPARPRIFDAPVPA